jgi:hypothetical protein
MKNEAIKEFSDAVQQELSQHFAVTINGKSDSMPERIGKMHSFIAISDEKFETLYFGLLDVHKDLKAEDLDEVLTHLVQKHFGL